MITIFAIIPFRILLSRYESKNGCAYFVSSLPLNVHFFLKLMRAGIPNFGKNSDCLFGLGYEWKTWEFGQQSQKAIGQRAEGCKAIDLDLSSCEFAKLLMLFLKKNLKLYI